MPFAWHVQRDSLLALAEQRRQRRQLLVVLLAWRRQQLQESARREAQAAEAQVLLCHMEISVSLHLICLNTSFILTIYTFMADCTAK